MCSDRTKEIGYKVKEFGIRLDIREKFFAVGMVRHWNKSCRCPIVEVFKVKLIEPQRHMILSKIPPNTHMNFQLFEKW